MLFTVEHRTERETLIPPARKHQFMSDSNWTDRIAGERMAVDQRFNEQVKASSFSSQQWGLVMTAVEFEIENPGDPDAARIVADTSKLSSVMPEMERVANQGPMGGPGGDQSGGSGGGLLSGVKDALGLGGSGGGNKQQEEEAARLAQAYAEQLQEKLESNGRWKSVCEQAQG
ncbi:hypothetical protein C435_05668 [Haloarcula marismortui ATCC 33799]|uniref:Uncharacterized protein n=2 Tax=Haloarculaceae TaxID=1963268 RepID=M0KQT8_9EURY|nr:hypothetical protein C435_05668 [Haloarcula californiae ATCC 33799]